MKQALFFDQLSDRKVRCTLCPWNCLIAPGKVGICGFRKNEQGRLYSLIYNKVSSLAVDPIEKKPLYHFHPGSKVLSAGTFGCNMKCGHCQNWQISRVSSELGVISSEEITPERLIEMAKETGSAGIAWTYNEPTIWFEYILESAKLAKQDGLYTVYVTNGYVNPEPLDLIGPYLDAYRVDIKGFNNDLYQKLCKIKDFQPILDSAVRAKKKWKMHVEVVTNVIPTLNDDEKQLKGLAEWIVANLGPETPWHVTRFFPYLDYKHLELTPIETLEKAKKIGQEAGLKFVHLGNV